MDVSAYSPASHQISVPRSNVVSSKKSQQRPQPLSKRQQNLIKFLPPLPPSQQHGPPYQPQSAEVNSNSLSSTTEGELVYGSGSNGNAVSQSSLASLQPAVTDASLKNHTGGSALSSGSPSASNLARSDLTSDTRSFVTNDVLCHLLLQDAVHTLLIDVSKT
jgi:hypothetical protein